MAGTVTEPEAVERLGVVIGTWARAADGIVAQSSAAARAVVAEIEAEVRRRAAHVAALESALSAATPQARGSIAQELALAAQSLDQARSASVLAGQAAHQTQVLERRVIESTGARVPDAIRSLARKSAALVAYQAVHVPSATSDAPPGASSSTYRVADIVDIPVGDATFDDNPILDDFTKGGASKIDYRWAVETWDTAVRPGILAGKTREDFAQRDAQMGRHSGFRRLSGVYDMFLGNDPIAVSRRADGTLEVGSGRHRLEIAKQLGIERLPGKILG